MADKTFDHGIKPPILDQQKESSKPEPVAGDKAELERLAAKLKELRYLTYEAPIYENLRIQPSVLESVTLTGGEAWVGDADAEIEEVKRRIAVIDPTGELDGK